MADRLVSVILDKRNERLCGVPTGRVVYHVSERRHSGIIPNGCPLGRGGSEDAAMVDFCFRAEQDNPGLRLQIDELYAWQRNDWTGSNP